MIPGQVERAKNYGNRIHVLKHLLAMQMLGDEDIEDPRNFPEAKRVIRTSSGKLWRNQLEALSYHHQLQSGRPKRPKSYDNSAQRGSQFLFNPRCIEHLK